mgnify:CR=1 FL=1
MQSNDEIAQLFFKFLYLFSKTSDITFLLVSMSLIYKNKEIEIAKNIKSQVILNDQFGNVSLNLTCIINKNRLIAKLMPFQKLFVFKKP